MTVWQKGIVYFVSNLNIVYVDAVDETDLTKFVKITVRIMTSPFLDVSINKFCLMYLFQFTQF